MSSLHRVRERSGWVKIRGLMLFRQLDPLSSVEALVLAYRFTDRATDLWTERFNAFKLGDTRAVQGACRVLSHALQDIKFTASPVLLTGAIPSAFPLLPTTSPIYVLGSSIAERLGWIWCPQILRKRRHRQLHSIYNSSRRDVEVEGAYRCTARGLEGTILVLDDFITRGSTLREIVRAIKQNNPAINIIGLALGKTENVTHGEVDAISNDHVPEMFGPMWDSADAMP